MGSEWRESTWGNEISLEYGKRLKNYKDGAGNYRVFGSNGPVGWTEKPLTSGPGVILGRKGANRGVEFSRDPFFVIDTAYYVKPKTELDMRWLYYAIKHYNLGNIDDGSPIPSTTRSAVYVSRLKVPPLPEQRAIAHILGSLDDKIELNRRMNETLEGMAQALFKSWFVDFDPVIDNVLAAGNEIPEELKEKAETRKALGKNRNPLPKEIQKLFPDKFEFTEQMGWIPKGWELQTLYDMANFVNGAAYKGKDFTDSSVALPVVKIAEVKNGITAQTKFTEVDKGDKYKIGDGEILLSWSGNPDTSIDTFIWTNGEGYLNQHIFRVSLHNDADRYFVYYQLRSLRPVFAEIARDKQTTGLGHFTAGDMKQLRVFKPEKELLVFFNKAVAPLYKRSYENNIATRTLTKFRNTLLPKLISGELRIENTDKIVGEKI